MKLYWVTSFGPHGSLLSYRLLSYCSNTLATWCKEMAHLKRPWCWERLKVGGEGDDRGWDGWMTSPTQWTWVWASSGSWWWAGRPGVLQSMGSQRVRHEWVTELNWTWNICLIVFPTALPTEYFVNFLIFDNRIIDIKTLQSVQFSHLVESDSLQSHGL